MYLFLCIFSLLLYWILKTSKNINNAKRIYIGVMTFTLCLISSVRHLAVGVDTFTYYINFVDVEHVSWNFLYNDIVDFFRGNPSISDPAFTIFSKFFSSLNFSFYIYSFIIAFVLISAIGRIIYKSVEDFSGYFLCYSYYISLMYFNCPNNLMRQTLAMGLLLWAIIILVEKNKILYTTVLIIIAVSVHKTSILGIIPVVLLYVHSIRNVYLGGLIMMPVIMFLGSSLVNFLAQNSGSDKYLMYMNVETEARPIVYIAQMLIFYIIGLFGLKHMDKQHRYIRLSYMCFAIALSLTSLLWVSSDMVRISYYFSIWGIPFVAISMQTINTSYKKWIYILYVLLLLGRVVLYPMPYRFYWEKMELHDRYINVYR